MQMKTYWSGKKNQYLAPGGIYISGKMEHYYEIDKSDPTKKIYYYLKVNPDGTVDDTPTTDPSSGIPYYKWKGQWEEGIVSTLFAFYEAGRDGIKSGSFADTKNIISARLWNNPDENLRTAYRSNIKQFGYDCLMWGLIGNLLTGFVLNQYKEADKDNKKRKSLESAILANATNFGYRVLKNSADDLNMIHSIAGLGVQWTPFALSYFTNIYQTWSRAITSDNNTISDAFLNTFSVTKQLKPTIDYFINPNNPKDNKWSR